MIGSLQSGSDTVIPIRKAGEEPAFDPWLGKADPSGLSTKSALGMTDGGSFSATW
jgi:hypothetical protein